MANGRRPKQSDIAQRMGVSISTVSRALAQEAGISESVRAEVHRVAQSIGYKSKHVAAPSRPDRRAVALVPLGGATGGLSGFYVGIVDGMRAEAQEGGINLDVRLVNDSLITVEQIQRHVVEANANSILLAGIDPKTELIDWCREQAVAMVLVNGTDPEMRISSVAPANFYGAALATRMLVEAGHRRILHYSHRHRPTILERQRGFEAAIAETPGAVGRVVTTAARSSTELVDDIVAAPDGFTALFCWNDLAAIEVLDHFNRLRIAVPQNFSVVGFDDLPYAGMTSPRLSTVRVDREAIGRGAIRLVLQHLAGETAVQQLEIGLSVVPGGTIVPIGQPARG